MIFVQMHLGDWMSGTSLLTATERGVYFDLLVQYYLAEHPLSKDECKRIARAYAPAEQDAMQFVLHRFFIEEGDTYRHKRCDKEIGGVGAEKKKGLSLARRRAAWSRWHPNEPFPDADDANADANAMQVHQQKDANAMLTQQPNNPITQDDLSLVEKAPSELFPMGEEEKSNPLSICPANEIVELFNHVLGQHLGAVRKVTPARQQVMRARWRDMIKDSGAKTRAEGLDWCRQYFEAVAKRPFLMGQKADSKWHADFDWLMQSKNYTKIFEGAYRG